MDDSLAALVPSRAPLAARLRLARGIARAVDALHRRGVVHGALRPRAVLVAADAETVALAPAPRPPPPLALAGWSPPEVVRGARPGRSADVFAAAALARLALTGRGPWDGGDALEVARRVLFEPPRPARLDEPGIPPEVDDAIARGLEARPGRRGTAGDLARVIEEAMGRRSEAGDPELGGAAPDLEKPSTATATDEAESWTKTKSKSKTKSKTKTKSGWRAAFARVAQAMGTAIAALGGRLPASPLHRAALAAAPLLAALVLLPGADGALAREVEGALARGDVGAARALLDAAPRRADRALVEKLRGDVACARRVPGECLRRYRMALAARSAFRDDGVLRRNVRALLDPDESCATRRAAALLAGELRDPEALPALEAARRRGGLLAFLCTGDALDRAIAATRAGAR